jgi:SPP1 gp7 family putative phage head morphogenesis protein
MIDFPSDVRERELRILVARLQYERHVEQETAVLIEREFNRVLDLILSAKYRDLTAFQRQRAAELFRELDRILHSGYTLIADQQVKAMQAYAQVESDLARATVNAVLATNAGELAVSFYRLPKAYLASIAKLPIQGLKIGDWFEAQAATMSRETRRILQQGLVEGKGPAEISRRILADDRAQAPVLSRRAKNEARAIVRTTVNAVQNDAQMTSLAALPPELSDSYMLVAVLDKRTTAICRALDGRVFRYSDPAAKKPPFHIGCRTTMRALIRGAGVTLAEQKDPPTMSAYTAWLTAQNITTQNEILGPTRAQWFRDGKMSLADAIDADTRVLTLPQLRQKLGLGPAPKALATA